MASAKNDADLVEGIVALPTQLFYSVAIPVTLWFFNKAKARQLDAKIEDVLKAVMG